ncbi:predicted protein [Nematostella vectensis]|uniref:Vacuolar protein sorting-associated protein VTA1 homolog n=1 Tax=Nematostella vectensis TaxID=45351 RepID=A7RV00_NEMVE|nr:predicted protein [Nematostella vectensis]|eukprot:XP_001636765.1 predicted protein [Nematostella vectensis]
MAADVPPSLKPIQPYLKVAKEYEKRDRIVAYYCNLFAVQKGIKLDSKSPDGKKFLFTLMDKLEKTKKELAGEDAITSDIVGQAHMDEQARQLFLWADTEDRAARFNKNVIKSFYTASLIYDTLAQFGELTDEAAMRQKYSKWKATYINKCLKEGATPTPGPPGGEEDEFGGYFDGDASGASASGEGPSNQSTSSGDQPPAWNAGGDTPPQPQVPSSTPPKPAPRESGATSQEDMDKALKFCRFATSALQYEDVPTAIDNLQKALKVLKKQ